MKLLFIEFSNFVDFPIGGQLTFIRNFISLCDNHEVSAIGIDSMFSLAGYDKEIIPGRSIKFKSLFDIKYYKHVKLIPHRLIFVLLVGMFGKRLELGKYDFIIIHSPDLVLPLLKFKQKIVLRMAGANNPLSASRFRLFRRPFFQKLYSKFALEPAYSNISKAISINKDCTEFCKKFSITPLEINLSVDTNKFQPLHSNLLRSSYNIQEDTPVFIFSGRLAKIKRIDLIIRSLRKYIDRFGAAYLFIVGLGEEFDSLKALALGLGIGSYVVFYGQADHEFLIPALNSADVFIMASEMEGVPNALLEAMACGKSVVSTGVGGIGELIKDGHNGLLIHKLDPDVVSEVMRKAYLEKQELGRNARCSILMDRSFLTLIKNIEEYLHARQ